MNITITKANNGFIVGYHTNDNRDQWAGPGDRGYVQMVYQEKTGLFDLLDALFTENKEPENIA